MEIKRDCIGETPLYFRSDGSTSVSLKDFVQPSDKVNVMAMASFLYHQYVPGRETVYKDIYKVPSGHELTTPLNPYTTLPYWSFKEGKIRAPEKFWRMQLQDVLDEIVEKRIDGQEDVGVFLSGGLDSAIITALVKKHAKRVHTFAIGFPTFSELKYAKEVSERLGTIHHEIVVTPQMALECLPEVVNGFGEPMGDAATICNFILASEAKKYGLNFVFSGDGGDEVFAGYPQHMIATRLKWLLSSPRWLKAVGRYSLSLVPQNGNPHSILNQFCWMGGVFFEPSFGDTMAFMEKALSKAEIQWLTKLDCSNLNYGLRLPLFMNSTLHKAQAFDILNLLPEKFCMKSFKGCGLAGVSVVAPFLDPYVVTLAFRMPPNLKLRGRQGKIILRLAFEDMLPQAILDRKKQGFGTPVAAWIEDVEFGAEIYNTLTSSRLARSYYRLEAIEKLWGLVKQEGVRTYHEANAIWTLYALAAWYQAWVA